MRAGFLSSHMYFPSIQVWISSDSHNTNTGKRHQGIPSPPLHVLQQGDVSFVFSFQGHVDSHMY